MTTWLVISLFSFSSAVLAASVPLWMCVRLRKELRTLNLRAATHEELIERTGATDERVSGLESRIRSIEETRTDNSEWISQAESLNLNRRGQVLRLHHRGDSVPEIASALRVGQGEVKLIIKVHEICREPGFGKKP